MRLAPAAALAILLLLSACFAYEIRQTREEMLAYYYASIDPKIPRSARVLVGDERVNVVIGKQTIGFETRHGALSSFELYPVENPGVVITVSEEAAEKMARREMGILEGLENGGIRIEPKNLLSALKVEMIKRIYAVSGADQKIFGSRADEQPVPALSSIYMRRVTIRG